MRIRYFWLSVTLVLILTGCKTTQSNLDQPFIFNSQEDTYTHNNSDFVFPSKVGEFKRKNDFKQYDSSGHNIAVSYNLITNEQKAAGTVYVYPGMREYAITPIPKFGQTPNWFFEKHYDEVKTAIIDDKEARLLSENNFYLNRSLMENKGKKAVFEYDAENGETVLSQLYLFAHKGWLIKYRFSYYSKFADPIEPEIDRFLHLLTWP